MIRYQPTIAATAVLLCACSASVEPVHTLSQPITFATGEGQWQSASNLCLDADSLSAGAVVRTQLCNPSKQTQRWTITSARAGAGAWATSQALTNSGFVINGTSGQTAHLDAIPSILSRQQYGFAIERSTVHHTGEDACMDAGPQGSPAGTPVTFAPCRHAVGQIWLGVGGYNVAITSGMQADSSGHPFYVQEDRGATGHGALQLRQSVCASSSAASTRCAPTASQVFSLTPSTGSAGASIRAGVLFWSSNGSGPVTFSSQPQMWSAGKWTLAVDPSNPGAGTIAPVIGSNTLCSVSANTNLGAMSMVDATTDQNFVRDCDWSFVYESQ